MNLKKLFVTFLVGAAFGAGLLSYVHPEQQTKVVEVEKIKTQTVTKIIKPDGTQIIKHENKTQDLQVQKSEIKNQKAQYAITGGYSIHDQSSSIGVDRRIFGPLWVGGQISDKGNVSINAKWEF